MAILQLGLDTYYWVFHGVFGTKLGFATLPKNIGDVYWQSNDLLLDMADDNLRAKLTSCSASMIGR